MTQLSVMDLAKQGDPNAIAALINRSLASKGIHAQAELEAECLKISLRAAQIPNQKAVVTIIHRGMIILQVEQIKHVKIFTYRSDNNYLAWQHEINLDDNLKEDASDSQLVDPKDNKVQSTNLVSNPRGVILVQKMSQIQQNLQEYQDIIVRFTDEHVGTVRCLTTLTELIQVISQPSFLFAAVASNPSLRSLLDTIAESSKTDEHGDQVITNLSILQPGQQWQRAKIRLVTKIFLEPADNEPEADEVPHQGITLDLADSEPEVIKTPVDVGNIDDKQSNITNQVPAQILNTEINRTIVENIVVPPHIENIYAEEPTTLSDDITSELSAATESSTFQKVDASIEDAIQVHEEQENSITVNSLFDDFAEVPVTNPTAIAEPMPPATEVMGIGDADSMTVGSLFDDFAETPSLNTTSFETTATSDLDDSPQTIDSSVPNSDTLTVNSLFDDFVETSSPPSLVIMVNDLTENMDFADSLFDDFMVTDTNSHYEHYNDVSTTIASQELSPLSTSEPEEQTESDLFGGSFFQNDDSSNTSLDSSSDMGANTIENILRNMDTISLESSNSSSKNKFVTLENFSEDLNSVGF
ncbi:hypothetical protein [Pseudanabaena mucicola]|uniref:Uncharacterized protein n=1 Tax=Pseudanabaena mucicola FACHB-723 TaxID=2692860 RepID=A0ABR8A088_9CYAN|nr:hypothetical protein [Pseudanabaena mucicola]MBD2189651.1 hypothetical protein [Pseudanabaena mucicola FACHB-723]